MGLQAGAVSADRQSTVYPGADSPEYEATVVWYVPLKGIGFLKLEGYPREVLVHNSEVRAGDLPRDFLLKGDKLRCKVGLFRGRPVCTNLVMVRAAG